MKILFSRTFQRTTFPQLTSWIFGQGLSKYTYPLAEITSWGAIWTSALFNSQRRLTQLKFMLRHCVCLSQILMQPTMLSASFTRNECFSKRILGNEDVPLHLGSSQLRTERMKRINIRTANILKLQAKLKNSQVLNPQIDQSLCLKLHETSICRLRSITLSNSPHKIFH